MNTDRFEALRERLVARIGRYVDLYADYEMGSQPGVVLRIAAEGRPILDRDGYWKRLQRRTTRLRAHARQSKSGPVNEK